MYKEKTNQELISLLKDFETLHFESKLKLKEQIELRQLNFPRPLYDAFIDSIDLKYKEIEQLDYLNHLGFESEILNPNKFIIRRTFRAKLMNAIGAILSFLALFFGIDLIASAILLIKQDYSFWVAIILILTGTILSIFAALLFYKNINRLITYNGFYFSIESGKCHLTKRIDWVEKNFQKDIEKLTIKGDEKEAYLYLDDIIVFSIAKPSLLNSLTLEALIKTTKNYC